MIKRRRRIYYVPGMISLIVLPIICFLYLKKWDYKERVIELVMPSKYNPYHNGKNSLVFDTTVLSSPSNRRNYTNIELDGNSKNIKEKLSLFNDKVHRLISTNDTVNAIHLRLGKELTYGELIEALNICMFVDTFNYFIWYEDHLWYLHKNISTQRKIEIVKREQNWIKEQNELEKKQMIERSIELSNEPFLKRLDSIRKVWPCLIGVFLLGVISIRSMIKK